MYLTNVSKVISVDLRKFRHFDDQCIGFDDYLGFGQIMKNINVSSSFDCFFVH